MFKILKKDKKTKARLGILKTRHGKVKTPSYVIVATRGEIKSLRPSDIKRTKTQITISNTYHLWEEILNQKSGTLDKAGSENLKQKTFLTNKLGTRIPTMTDSGGFQVFSIAFKDASGVKKIFPENITDSDKARRKNIKITNSGVYFKIDSLTSDKTGKKWKFLSPEISMKLQEKIGADILFTFDELTYVLDSFKYTRSSLNRTHNWALRCLKAKRNNNQLLFGITQGGPYRLLRIKGAKFIGSLPFDGFGIGGSYSRRGLKDVLKWTIPHLPDEKPRHLLGVGSVEEIFTAIENGVDLFDCVIPTREARHGRIWTCRGYYDIRKSEYKNKKSPLEKLCKCQSCRTTSRAKLRHFFKNKDTVLKAQRLATIHNVYFFNNLVEKIRDSIGKDRFLKFKAETLKAIKKPL